MIMDKTFTFIIEEDTLIKYFLKRNFSATIEKRIKADFGSIKVNGEPKIATDKLKKGDVVTIFIKENSKPFPIAKELDLKVLYDDDFVTVVFKGKGICSVSVNGHMEDSIFAGLKYLFPNEVFRVVTRLDKDTEGFVLLAKNSYAHSILNESKIIKKYTAVLDGVLKTPLLVEAPIYRVDESIKRVVDKRGKYSATKITPISNNGKETVVSCELLTGRTHQIRVHTSFIGHPIKGDTLYGGGNGDYNSGQDLRCSYLEFIHPFTGKKIIIE